MNLNLSCEGSRAATELVCEQCASGLAYVCLDYGLEIDLRVHQSLQWAIELF